MYLYAILLLFLSMTVHSQQQPICQNSTTAYRIYLIDGTPSTTLINCSYSYNIAAGNCSLQTGYAPLAAPNYVCFGENSQLCNSINLNSFAGTLNRNCSGNFYNEPFTVNNVTPTQEFNITTNSMNARGVIGIECIDNSNKSTSLNNFKARNCTWNKPGGGNAPTNAASGLQLGLMMLILLIGLLFI